MNTVNDSNATKRIIIDAKQPQELRVAIIDKGNKKKPNILTDLHIEDENRVQYKSNIYLGTITSIEPSLNAIFVQYDTDKRHGFLPFKEITSHVYEAASSPSKKDDKKDNKKASSKPKETPSKAGQSSPSALDVPQNKTTETSSPINEPAPPLNINIQTPATIQSPESSVNFELASEEIKTQEPRKKDVDSKQESSDEAVAKKLKIGQHILVQIVKEERGTKGAALTTHISLAGSFLVLMPKNGSITGISRRIEGSDRDNIREMAKQLHCPQSMGFIIRTAGLNQDVKQLHWDLDVLINLWHAIEHAVNSSKPPVLIHQESDVVVCAVRDHLRQQIGSLVVNDKTVYDKIRLYLTQVKPDFVDNVSLYTDDTPLFCHYGIENQIEQAHQREIRMTSGGSIIIDQTEALISIDVNSARAKGTDIEDTAFQTNLEAADEIARQLRLRDIGGLIVIDFIDMSTQKHQREVESHLRANLSDDRARLRIGRISSFGLLEMSRQRLRPSLGEVTKSLCPRCNGQGMIQSIESLALSILRRIQEDVITEQLLQVQIHVPIDVSAQLMNHHRNNIADIETHGKTSILIIPNPNFQTPQYRIKKIRFGDKGTKVAQMENKSYQMVENVKFNQVDASTGDKGRVSTSKQQKVGPVVEPPSKIPAQKTRPAGQGLVKRLWETMFQTSVTTARKTSANMDHDDDENIGNRKSTPSHHKTKSASSRRSSSQRRQGQRRNNRKPSDNKRPNQSSSSGNTKPNRSGSSTSNRARRPASTQKKNNEGTKSSD